MLFASPIYGVFLLFTYTVFWALRRRSFLRPFFLMVASYVFYVIGTYEAATAPELLEPVPLGPVKWTILCVAIIFVGSTLDYWIGRALGRTQDPKTRKMLLLVSVVYYLGVLSIFKYFDFAVDSFATVMGWAGVHVQPAHLRLVLPFGISFFTFETMSYTIDVYRREIPPADRYLDYLLFVCFFPHLVAGPIVRPRSMLPQLAAEPVASDAMKAHGLFLIATGLVKKVVIGDTLGLNLVNRVFDNPERFSSIECLVAVYAYAIKIYADFSGYSDVAIGSAKLFGYELPINFDVPYVSRSIQEFWRRWHISLSTWLRDYLYVTLGGNRHGTWKTYRNLLATMVLGGLWHGASWNFVIWGALHGGALAVERALTGKEDKSKPKSGLRAALSVFVVFHFVCFAWIFFRAKTFAHATLMITRIGKLTFETNNLAPKVIAVLLVAMVAHFVPKAWFERIRDAFIELPAVAQGIALAACAYALHFASGAKTEPFIYGQF
ncbi:MAG: MBOAT family protein [Deltaproteobacteria bacterium]|nr:MBOAT family protein [Deltaproteobacteria bacterium]